MEYTKENIKFICDDIFEEIVEGRAIRAILKDSGMPSPTTFFKWLREDKELAEQYAQACEQRALVIFESMKDDFNEDPEYVSTAHGSKIDNGWVQLQALKINTKKWMLAKLAPKVFGDKIDVTTDGEKLPATAAPAVWNFINANKDQSDKPTKAAE